MSSTQLLAAVAGLMALLPAVRAGYDPTADDNLSVYWGQNSYNQLGFPSGQQRLSYYCETSPDINIIPLAFLDGLETPTLNLANALNNCTAIAGSNLFSCPQVEADIQECQSTYGVTILLSLGGSTYTEGGFSSSAAAVTAAQNVWAMFGPVQSGSSAPRPFGSAVVDGFDFDFESSVQNMEPFAAELRSLGDAAAGTYYLSAAPQCPYPDASDESFIDGEVDFDWVQVQFYNNFCGVDNFENPNGWDFSTWNTWATTVSANPAAKVLLGIAANTGAANAGSYVDGTLLAEAIASSKSYPSFGGVMMWDMSQLYANTGFEAEVVSDLTAPASSSPTTTASSPPPTSSSTGTGTVPQWGQCGGEGYTGPTQCVSPYSCVATSEYWSQCE